MLRSELLYALLFVLGIWINDLLRLVLNTVRYVIAEILLRRKGVQTRIANECSVTNECRYIFNPDVMWFGGIVDVFKKQEIHVVFSFAFGAAIFHREPPATLLECKNVYGYGGVEFFEQGDLFCLDRESQPLDFERVFVSFIL